MAMGMTLGLFKSLLVIVNASSIWYKIALHSKPHRRMSDSITGSDFVLMEQSFYPKKVVKYYYLLNLTSTILKPTAQF